MSYVFRLHSTGNNQLKNWESTQSLGPEDIHSIPDTVQSLNTGKVGASIPSPFARMYLFEAAFQFIVRSGQPKGNSIYYHLVSDCLDMFQFLYMNAGNPDISFKKWDKKQRLDDMAASAFDEHRRLAKTLDLFFSSGKFANLKEIYLMYFKDVLVGGTSPITLLYASPNWKRVVKQQGWIFRTPTDGNLFGDAPTALFERDENFQLYLYKMVYAYNDLVGVQSPEFFSYFDLCRKHSPALGAMLNKQQVDVTYSRQQFEKDYDFIKFGEETIYSGQCPLLKPKSADVVTTIADKSDFLLMPTKSHYKSKVDELGQAVEMHTPLVLAQGNHRLNYVNAQWDPAIRVPDVPLIPLHKRKLPELNIPYPYVTLGDFLEDVLVELPYNINSERFFTGCSGSFKYLLPIKKEYFNFFGIEDLQQQLQIWQDVERRTVDVLLKVPIKNGRTLEFAKTYQMDNDQQIARQRKGKGFNMGITPFFKMADDALNTYGIGVVSNLDELNVAFYKLADIINERTTPSQKTSRGYRRGDSMVGTYYTIEKNTFDLVEVSLGAGKPKGLVLPKFLAVDAKERESAPPYYFAVDFGTTNTFVAYDTGRAAEGIRPFEVLPKDQLMVLLSELDRSKDNIEQRVREGAKDMVTTIDVFEREFAPIFMATNLSITTPFRTAICELSGIADTDAQLFANMNIGFAMEKDYSVNLSNNEYLTDIKWRLTKEKMGKPEKRVAVLFRELLWMMRNKLATEGGSLRPEIFWMVPLSMSRKTVGIFADLWQKEADQIFGQGNASLSMRYESVVPYYALNAMRGQDALNIDIGGGSTDILFFCMNKKEFYGTSFRFAGNDIWGDGLSPAKPKDNGFVEMMRTKLEGANLGSGTMIEENIFKLFCAHDSMGSADICSLLFRYDNVYKFSGYIDKEEKFNVIFVLHLSAILYHIAQIIKNKNIDIPLYISFTGKGSEYIKLIAKRPEDITYLVLTFLEVFSGKTANRRLSKVILHDNPKQVTAEGALWERRSNDKIDKSMLKDLVLIGGDKQDYTLADLAEAETAVRAQLDDFLEKLHSRTIVDMLKEFDISLRVGGDSLKDVVRDFAEASFSSFAHEVKEGSNSDDYLQETPFFWYFKDTLYRMSQELNRQ
jgi:hypothetical protein